MFTESPSVVSATAVAAVARDVNTSMNGVAASRDSLHRSLNSSQNTRSASDARPVHKYSGEDRRSVNDTLTCDVTAESQTPRRASSHLNKIFQTSELELTDADLEFNP